MLPASRKEAAAAVWSCSTSARQSEYAADLTAGKVAGGSDEAALEEQLTLRKRLATLIQGQIITPGQVTGRRGQPLDDTVPVPDSITERDPTVELTSTSPMSEGQCPPAWPEYGYSSSSGSTR